MSWVGPVIETPFMGCSQTPYDPWRPWPNPISIVPYQLASYWPLTPDLESDRSASGVMGRSADIGFWEGGYLHFLFIPD